jgi:hypothetical protein
MIEELEKKLKDDKDFKGDNRDIKKIKNKNAINRFLKSYFHIFVLVFILLFLYLSFSFLIKPKFDKVTYYSDDILEERENEFIDIYKEFQLRKAVIHDFRQIEEIDKYRVGRMIPEEYSKDDLFVEIAYFLMENNFDIISVEVIDPSNLESQDDNRDDLGRRTNNETDTSNPYETYLNQLPNNVGTWLAKISLSDMNYRDLKRLLGILEKNLKLFDVFSLDFDPQEEVVEIEIFSYYYKNN